MIRIGILSFWHVHAYDYAAEAEAHPGAEVVAVWDEGAERGRAEAGRLNPGFYPNLGDLLARPDIDAVVVTTPTSAHGEVIPAVARAGKHILTEKVIAPTLRETREIVAEVERAGVAFVVSLPRLYAGYTAAIRETIEGGLLGELTQVRVRVSHDGALPSPDHSDGWLPAHFFDPEQAGGGVLIDFGCHPLYLVRLLLWMPESVSASYGYVTGRRVEDNAVVTFQYPGGALGVAEASFVGGFSPFTIEAHGTAGSLLYGTPEPRLLVRSAATDDGAGWVEQEDVPQDGVSPFSRWIEHIKDGTRDPENVTMATDLSAIVEVANRSAAEGRAVRLDELA